MRRLLTLAAFLLILSIVPVCAQHGGHGGGGSHGGGTHGGFSGAHSGFGGHSAVGGHSFGSGGAAYGPHAALPSRPNGGPGFSHYGPYLGSRSGWGRRGNREGRSGGTRWNFRTRCYGCRGYRYPYYGYYDPYWDSWWWDSGSSLDGDEAQQRQMASRMNEENLQEQQALNDRDQDAYAQPMPRGAAEAREEHARNDPATILVFRDKRQREIQNYAIVGPMLWHFSGARTEKIPLATLDIPATIRANDDRGIDFRLPGTGEGQ
jgi:hypothetical protein